MNTVRKLCADACSFFVIRTGSGAHPAGAKQFFRKLKRFLIDFPDPSAYSLQYAGTRIRPEESLI